jgi:hemerythrin
MATRLSDAEKEIGDNAPFGSADVLVPADHDYTKAAALKHLRAFMPSAPEYELYGLLNCPVASFSPGSVMVRKGQANQEIFLVLSGVLEFLVPELGVRNILTAGSLIGELSGVLGTRSRGTYRAISVVKTVRIHRRLYVTVLRRNRLLQSSKKSIDLRRFLQDTWIFGERLSCPTKNRITQEMTPLACAKGRPAPPTDADSLFLVKEGRVGVYTADLLVEEVGPGGFAGEEAVLLGAGGRLTYQAIGATSGYLVPSRSFEDIPIVQWKLLETLERRTRAAGLSWRPPTV